MDVAPPLAHLGATRDEKGAVTVLYTFCSGKPLAELQVGILAEQKSGTDKFFTLTKVLWRIRANTLGQPEDGAATGRVIIGVAPPGYTEVVPLDGPLPSEERLSVKLATERPETQGDSFGESLRLIPADVPVGSVFDDLYGRRSVADYHKQASKACGKFK